MSLFRPNLEVKGRILRGVGALAFFIGALLVWPSSHAAGVALALSAAFLAFEATRGWCAVRACGIRTKY